MNICIQYWHQRQRKVEKSSFLPGAKEDEILERGTIFSTLVTKFITEIITVSSPASSPRQAGEHFTPNTKPIKISNLRARMYMYSCSSQIKACIKSIIFLFFIQCFFSYCIPYFHGLNFSEKY